MHHCFYIAIFVLVLRNALAYENVPSNEEMRAWRLIFTKQKEPEEPEEVVGGKKEKESSSSDEQTSYRSDSTSNELTTELKGSVVYGCKNPNHVALTFDDGIRYFDHSQYRP